MVDRSFRALLLARASLVAAGSLILSGCILRLTEDPAGDGGDELTGSATASPNVATPKEAGEEDSPSGDEASANPPQTLNETVASQEDVEGGPGAKVLLFVDGAENDTTQWEITSRFLGNFPPMPAGKDHPRGKWQITSKEAFEGTHAWTAPYTDMYETTMISTTILIPAVGPEANLSYRIMGGVEDNPNVGLDGLHVFVQPEGEKSKRIIYNTNDIPTWTEFTASLEEFRGKTIRLEFTFLSDLFCSADTPAADQTCKVIGPPFGTTGGSFRGYHLDNIMVYQDAYAKP